jgi:flagellar biosynthesis protein FlhF
MRLKTFHAESMKEAMELVRDQLGVDAIIVATHEDENGRDVRITAAVEEEDIDPSFEMDAEPLNIVDQLSIALDAHSVPTSLADTLLNAASNLGIAEPVLALAGALDDCFAFSPLPAKRGPKPLMFIGPPGSGKTVSMAKLAVRTRLENNPVSFISTDTLRAGAIDQLTTYAKHLKADFRSASDPVSFIEAIRNTKADAQLLIDTAGVNPHNAQDMHRLAEFADAAQVERILVIAAGGDAAETAELAVAFAPLKPARLLVTRLDMVRRLGGILAAAAASRLPFCDVSVTPDIASGLRPINPVSLARLLLPDLANTASSQTETMQATGYS